jgi:dihydropteroate synthase
MNFKDTLFSVKLTINCNGRLIDFNQPRIMGILNHTPDSFYDGGKYMTENEITSRIQTLISEGADLIDVGAYSSRPGASEVTIDEEKSRLSKVLRIIVKSFPDAIVSVDTFRADVAEYVVKEYGVAVINDISAGMLDKRMFDVVGALKIPYIMMHMKGNPQNMQKNPVYDDITRELISFFTDRIQLAVHAGIEDIIVDPGFGFGKTTEHNFKLLKELSLFGLLEYPIMAGLSRKSMIYKSLNRSPGEALNGTTVLNTIALLNGARILRVHDVKEASEAILLYTLYKNS